MTTERFHRIHLVLVAILVLMTSMAGEPAAAGPDLRLRPNDGVTGETVVARGRDFGAGAAGTIVWGNLSASSGEFVADDGGEFEVTLTVPDVPPGDYVVAAIASGSRADDVFTVEAPDREDARSPATPPQSILDAPADLPVTAYAPNVCDEPGTRQVRVGTGDELTAALDDARPGDRIELAGGTYLGNFGAGTDGTAEAPIALCGSRGAVLDGDGWERSGYALWLQGDSWTVSGITVTNAQKGVMLDGASNVVLDNIEVHTVGREAVHFRTNSSDNVIQRSDIHDTGLDNEKFGEGVYLGSAVSNWPRYTEGEPDRSDRNQVFGNRIWNTTAESVDVKEGTEGGLVEGNVFDGSLLSGADSWVDVKGNGYVVRGNTGTNSPQDGFQTHVIDDMEWGRQNVFHGNVANVHGPGVGFYIHQPAETDNVVLCDNMVDGAAGGFSNLEGRCADAGASSAALMFSRPLSATCHGVVLQPRRAAP